MSDRDIIWLPLPRRSMREIAAEVAARHGLTLEDLRGFERKRRYSWPRQEAMAVIYGTGRYSLLQIARFFGGRDHTSVLFNIRTHQARIAQREGEAA